MNKQLILVVSLVFAPAFLSLAFYKIERVVAKYEKRESSVKLRFAVTIFFYLCSLIILTALLILVRVKVI